MEEIISIDPHIISFLHQLQRKLDQFIAGKGRILYDKEGEYRYQIKVLSQEIQVMYMKFLKENEEKVHLIYSLNDFQFQPAKIFLRNQCYECPVEESQILYPIAQKIKLIAANYTKISTQKMIDKQREATIENKNDSVLNEIQEIWTLMESIRPEGVESKHEMNTLKIDMENILMHFYYYSESERKERKEQLEDSLQIIKTKLKKIKKLQENKNDQNFCKSKRLIEIRYGS